MVVFLLMVLYQDAKSNPGLLALGLASGAICHTQPGNIGREGGEGANTSQC